MMCFKARVLKFVGVGRDLTNAVDVCTLAERVTQVFVYATLLGGCVYCLKKP